MEFQGDWTIRKSNPAAFLIASEVTTPGSPMAHIECGCAGRTQGNNMFRNTKYSNWWGIRDSNPYAFRHMILSHARLPIPPIPHIATIAVADHTRLYLRETVCLNLVVTPSPLQLSLTNGGEGGIRTHDRHGLTVRRSNQLSYIPI